MTATLTLSRGPAVRVPGLSVRTIATTLAGLIILVLIAWVIAPSLFTSHDPYAGVPAERFAEPSAAHLFGTDQLGRDVFARVVHGTRPAVLSALLAVTIGLVAGSAIGLLAGFFGGIVDGILGRVLDIVLAIPSFLLAVIVVVSLGFQTVNAAIAVGVSSIAVFGRLIRSEVLRVKNLTFVESAYLIGGSRLSVLFAHVLPNTYRSVVALAVLQFGLAIISIAGLAFLGYGNPPPSPDWGLLVAEGKDYLYRYPWVVYLPGLVMVATVLSLNQLSTTIGKDK
ncbi:ABC transporter permease subunit [Gordonia amarae]|uniref:ABC transporter permease subunit n=2 Tax=Gordonia amarae TaxID=36821 RepID=A0A857KM20_9ACTN|nr:ABC transporter permease [Gordonia amarae]MCS3879883.1 peptide/nickel transport system permease protein [Gordonia amarae]QHN18293.1 ABC transporter permease subunit [Gordonia amarae]QHN22776.1 ABC transporter permease subunit [Gordonia amarae]QHN31680.1 ABC transporter permease subunit [Gordonia amarae]QHN40424.1 ABC transporter permease subunit [Gordonia amarae]